jgi:hypothetical protein
MRGGALLTFIVWLSLTGPGVAVALRLLATVAAFAFLVYF